VEGERRDAAVVGEEDDHRVFAEAEFVELGDEGADGLIDAFGHGGVDGVVAAGRVFPALVAVDQVLLGLDGRVDGVVGQIDEERVFLVGFDEGDRFAGKAVGEVVAVLGVGDFDEGVGREHRLVSVPVAAGEGQVEAAVLGSVVSAAEVPLAYRGGGVAGGLERLGDNGFVEREAEREFGLEELGVGQHVAGQVLGDAGAGGPASGEDGAAGGRAVGGGGVSVSEAHAVGGEAVDVGGLVIGVAVGADVGVTHVVEQEEDDVGRAPGGLLVG